MALKAYRCNRCQRVVAYGDLAALSAGARAPIQRYHDEQVAAGEWTEVDAVLVVEGTPFCTTDHGAVAVMVYQAPSVRAQHIRYQHRHGVHTECNRLSCDWWRTTDAGWRLAPGRSTYGCMISECEATARWVTGESVVWTACDEHALELAKAFS